jgi:hypothetical protein
MTMGQDSEVRMKKSPKDEVGSVVDAPGRVVFGRRSRETARG